MKRFIPITLFLIVLLAATFVLDGQAAPGSPVTVIIDWTRFYVDGSESPVARLHEAWIFPCDGGKAIHYYVYPHPDDVWVNMGFKIARVEYTWHYGIGGGPDSASVAYGTCQGKEVIPKVFLYSSESGFFTNQDGGLVNTCTIVSDLPASIERITALCASTPTDMKLECNGPVKQLAKDDWAGYWPCDPNLRLWGEARLPLFDPEGGTGTGTLFRVYTRHLQTTEH